MITPISNFFLELNMNTLAEYGHIYDLGCHCNDSNYYAGLFRFISMKLKSVTFIDSTFRNCYFDDVTSVGSFFRNCTFIDAFFVNTGEFLKNNS